MRKRKTHIISFGIYSVCGAAMLTAYNVQHGGRIPVNGKAPMEVKSLCQITCKLCRNTWDYRMIGRRLRDARKERSE